MPVKAKLTKPPKAIAAQHLSPDGRWRSFPNVPNLLQYARTRMFYGRVKVGGKIIRRSLATDTFTTAKLRLLDFLKLEQTSKPQTGDPVTIAEVRKLYEANTQSDHALADASKRARLFSLKALMKSWPGFDGKQIVEITKAECLDWAGRFAPTCSNKYFNEVLGTLRALLELGAEEHKSRCGAVVENAAKKVKRLGIKPKKLELPEPGQFRLLVDTIAGAGARQSQDCAHLVQFLAFSGCRVSEAKQVTWGDVDLQKGEMIIHSAKRQKVSDAARIRRLPINPPMRGLLKKLEAKHGNDDAGTTVCRVHECEKSLTNACKKLGLARITHHDLRHLFATRCIEAGVDVPTVSRWLGHSDGGALAMKTYGHLRNEHSLAMAQKVTF